MATSHGPTPAARTLTSACPAAGVGSGRSVISKLLIPPNSRTCATRISSPPRLVPPEYEPPLSVGEGAVEVDGHVGAVQKGLFPGWRLGPSPDGLTYMWGLLARWWR